MKITIEHYKNIITWNSNFELSADSIDDLDLQDALIAIKGMLISVGFHENIINDFFIDFGDKLKEDLNNTK